MSGGTVSRRGFLRRVAWVGAAPGAAAAVGLGACSVPGSGGTDKPTAAGRRDVTLYYQSWDDITGETAGSWGQWYKWVFSTFAEQHPGAKVEYVLTPFGEIVPKIIATVAAGTPVDAGLNSIVHGRDLFDKGALTAIEDRIRKVPELAPSKYFDVANFYRQTQGKVFGLPLYQDSSLVGVNMRLLREAGLDPKAADLKTWDDLVRYAERLTRREGDKITQVGFPFNRPGLEELATYTYGNGAELHDPEVTKPLFNTPPNAARMAEMLRFRGTNYQRFRVGWAESMTGDLWATGKAALAYGGWGFLIRIMAGTYVPKDFEYWFIPNPKGPGGNVMGAATWVNMVVLPKGGKEQDLAFELAHLAGSPQSHSKMFQLVGHHPSFKDFYQTKEFDEGVRQYPVHAIAPQLAANSKSYPFFRRFNDVNQQVAPLFGDAVEGKLDHQQALAEAERLAKQILSS
jgi:ABC-type glycerol-3-phosphate transport system substrate-binding protein